MGAAAPLPERDDAVLTVSGPEDLDLLVRHGSPHQVMVKLRSSMHRFGVTADEVADLLTAVDRRLPGGVAGAALHLPLATTQDENRRQIEAWLRLLPPGIGLSVSHLDDATWRALTAAHPDRALRRRMGTALWHGDKSMLHLEADVLAVHTVAGGEPVGYRQGPAPAGGVVVLVGCGSAHGVAPLDDGRSPFHHARRRLPLLEPPHMHTSMLFVAADDPVAPPGIGDWIDVQRPLTGTAVDTVDWR
jgi:alanine racemase